LLERETNVRHTIGKGGTGAANAAGLRKYRREI
jgi:hypothetical protein